jgi:hypothetical protein
MNILVSGCSFTQWPEYVGGPNTCWPRYLAELEPNWRIKNIAEPGAGNQYISDSVMRHIIENPLIKYDRVLVMWTGVSRLDYLTGLEDPSWNELFNSYGFYRRVDSCPDKLGYIFSGGQMGTWFNNPVAEKMFREMYKVSSPLSLATINIMEMIKLQNFLENQGIDYKFMSYVNYWGDGENLSRNGDFGVGKFPEVQKLLRTVDWSKWIFTDDNRNGIYEMAVRDSNLQDDRFHPAESTQRAWAGLVRQRLIA